MPRKRPLEKLRADPLPPVIVQLKDPARRAEALDRLGEWVKYTCLTFGVPIGLAYTVAGMFVEGLEREENDK